MAPLELTLAKLTLPLLAILACTTTFYLSHRNGFLQQLLNIEHFGAYLPLSTLPMKHNWINIKPLDDLAVQFIAFFWPVVNGANPSFSLQGIHFVGQGAALWILLAVEGLRAGNAWRLVSMTTILGLALENVLMALVLPLYCTLHLFTSPTVQPARSMTKGSGSSLPTALLAHPAELAILPWSIALGLGVPTAAVLLTQTGSIAQQTALVARQLHPLWAALAQILLSTTLGPLFLAKRTADFRALTTPGARGRAVMKALRSVYTFGTVIAVASHVGVVALMVASQTTSSVLATGYRAYFSPRAVFEPPKLLEASTWRGGVGFVEGAHVFLKWDELLSMTAALVWAVAVNRAGVLDGGEGKDGQKSGKGGRQEKRILGIFGWGSEYWGVRMRMLGWLVVGGPAAAAIKLVEERDAWWLVERSDVLDAENAGKVEKARITAVEGSTQ